MKANYMGGIVLPVLIPNLPDAFMSFVHTGLTQVQLIDT